MLGLLVAMLTELMVVSPAGPPTIVDGFEDAGSWKTIASDGVQLNVRPDKGRDGGCIRLDINFASGAGYGIVRKPVDITLPIAPDGGTGNYEFSFDVRGTLPANNLEFKLVEDGGAAGESVWWVNRRAFEFPSEWTTLVMKRRHVRFAWGPSNGKPLRHVTAIEFAIAAATGGKGSVWLDNLRYRELPEPRAIGAPAAIEASSSARADNVAKLACGDGPGHWAAAPDDRAPTLTLDMGATCEIGGVTLELTNPSGRPTVTVATAEDGTGFGEESPAYVSESGRVFAPLTERDARSVRVRFVRREGDGELGVRGLRVQGPEFAATPNALVRNIAQSVERGRWPRQFLDKQSYWTLIGAAGASDEALMNEEGAIELYERGASLEAFVFDRGRLLTWADGTHTQTLERGYLPIPTVTRVMPGLELRITACGDGKERDRRPNTLVRYELKNTGAETADGSLLLALRAIQVNPAWQNLNMEGGVASLPRIDVIPGRGLRIGDEVHLETTPGPARLGTASLFRSGDVVDAFANGVTPDEQSQEGGPYVSGGMELPYSLGPGERRSWYVIASGAVDERPVQTAPEIEARMTARANDWAARLNRVHLVVPPEAQHLADSIRSNLAYILINADGPAIQPGSRCYARSWIRDGCLTSSALLAMGHREEAVRFIDWYGEHLFESGKVPCVVDRRGPDPVPENDSHGEYIFAVMNAYRFTHDRTILERHWDRVKRAVAYIETLRDQRRTPEFRDEQATRQEPGKPPVPVRAFYGMMPESISHEGYSAKPMHSYWDDLFTLRGLKDAAEMAEVMGDATAAAHMRSVRDEFSADLANSVRLAMAAHGIAYVPGCVELGDFDSTSTTIGVWPVGAVQELTENAVRATFDRYWSFFQDRAREDATWDGFTPYELRHVGALVRLGEPERARAVLDLLMSFQRPQGWNEWAEVVFRDRDSPRYIGDMPHTWCGSDFINSARSMFVYEREDDRSLVVFAGVPIEWARSGQGVAIEDWPTWYGNLTASMKAEGERVTVRLSGPAAPPGGVEVSGGHAGAKRATIDGKDAPVGAHGGVVVRRLPAEVVIEY